ncbi:MAG: hypothetical protein IJD80_01295 [Oscillospiraceae bacterium]|nr:hypothetical protein [Oscillospiraceae bacterium]
MNQPMKLITQLKIILLAAAAVFTAACSADIQNEDCCGGVLTLTENAVLQLDEHISAISVDDLINPQKVERFSQAGIDISVENIQKTDNDNVSFVLALKKGLKKLEIPVNAKLRYRVFSEGDKIIDIEVYWGNISLCGNEIIHTSLDKIKIWSRDSFERIEKQFDFSFLPGTEQYLVDTIKNENGYTIAYYSAGEQGIAIMDSEGRFEKKHTLIQREPYIYFGTKNDHCDFNQNFRLTLKNYLFYIDPQQKYLAIINKDSEVRDGYIFDTEENTVFRTDVVFHYTKNDVTCIMLSRTGISAYPEGKKMSDYVAVRIKNHSPVSCFAFEKEGVDPAFGYDSRTGRRDILSFKTTGEMHTVKAYCSQTMQTVEIDFINKTVSISRQEAVADMEVVDTSKDGVYSVLAGENTDMADSLYRAVFLRENPTGETTHICDAQSGFTAGFYENNDIWILDHSDFAVFSEGLKTENSIFRLSDHMDFGRDLAENIAVKDLLYATRDAATGNCIAVYAQWDSAEEKYIEENSFQLIYTYRVCVADSEGNILIDTDTGENVVFTPMGYEDVKLRVEEGTKLLMYVYHPFYNRDTGEYEEKISVSGYIDTDDGSYTQLQPFTWGEL